MLQGFAGLQQGFLIHDAAAARQVILTRVRDLQGAHRSAVNANLSHPSKAWIKRKSCLKGGPSGVALAGKKRARVT